MLEIADEVTMRKYGQLPLEAKADLREAQIKRAVSDPAVAALVVTRFTSRMLIRLKPPSQNWVATIIVLYHRAKPVLNQSVGSTLSYC